MNVNDVYGTLYRLYNLHELGSFTSIVKFIYKFSPRDGVVDPAGFCTALTRAATKAGAKVIEDCVVTGVDTENTLFGSRRVSAIKTNKGTIKTKCVVNCTGKNQTALVLTTKIAYNKCLAWYFFRSLGALYRCHGRCCCPLSCYKARYYFIF